MKRLLSGLIFCSLFFNATAQRKLILDSTDIRPRTFSHQKMEKYKADKTFQYDRSLEGPKSDWRRFWDWVFEKLGIMISLDSYGVTILLIGSIVVIFLICILSFRRLNPASLFARRNTGQETGILKSEENIHEISFEEEIQKAIVSKDFRMAVRLLYLQTLKILMEKGRIKWQPNKSNAVYLNELNGSSYRHTFEYLTLQFENNWYGAIPINDQEFDLVAKQFQFFKAELVQT